MGSKSVFFFFQLWPCVILLQVFSWLTWCCWLDRDPQWMPQTPWANWQVGQVGQVKPAAQQAELPSPGASDWLPSTCPTYQMTPQVPLPRSHSLLHLEWMAGTSAHHDLFHVDHVSTALNFTFIFSFTPYMNPREILPSIPLCFTEWKIVKNAVKWKWCFWGRRHVIIT